MLDEADRKWIRETIREEIRAALAGGRRKTPIAASQELPMKDQVFEVFEHWKGCWNKTKRTKLDNARQRVIVQALRNYDVETIKASLTGYTVSPWHNGDENGHVYDEITLHLRDAPHIEAGLRFARQRNSPDRLVERALKVAGTLDRAQTK